MGPRRLTCIGKITAPHGVRGEMKLLPYLEETSYLTPSQKFYGTGGQALAVSSLRSGPKGFFLIKLTAVTSREEAEAWRNQDLYMDRDIFPALSDPETYYIEDLVGLYAHPQDEKGNPSALDVPLTDALPASAPSGSGLKVAAVHNFGAGDVLELSREGGKASFFVPFRKAAVPGVYVQEGYIVVNAAFLLENEGEPKKTDV